MTQTLPATAKTKKKKGEPDDDLVVAVAGGEGEGGGRRLGVNHQVAAVNVNLEVGRGEAAKDVADDRRQRRKGDAVDREDALPVATAGDDLLGLP